LRSAKPLLEVTTTLTGRVVLPDDRRALRAVFGAPGANPTLQGPAQPAPVAIGVAPRHVFKQERCGRRERAVDPAHFAGVAGLRDKVCAALPELPTGVVAEPALLRPLAA
jgi:hypothetical protein